MGDIIVLIVLGAIIVFVVSRMIKDKKSGKSCSCGCGECAMKEHCQSKNIKN